MELPRTILHITSIFISISFYQAYFHFSSHTILSIEVIQINLSLLIFSLIMQFHYE